MNKIQYIFIHHTAVSYQKNPDQWEATDNYHKSKGWGQGGYNYEVAKDGSIHQFREDGSITAAQYQEKMNDGRALSICLDGNFDEELPTEEQKATLAKFLQEKMAAYNIPKENIFGHRHIAPKTCPGKLLPDDLYSYFLSNTNPAPISSTKQSPTTQTQLPSIPSVTTLIRKPANITPPPRITAKQPKQISKLYDPSMNQPIFNPLLENSQ